MKIKSAFSNIKLTSHNDALKQLQKKLKEAGFQMAQEKRVKMQKRLLLSFEQEFHQKNIELSLLNK